VFIQILVDEKINAGLAIQEELRKDRFKINSAFWCRIPESGYWRLVIASPLVDRIGPLEGYKRLHSVLDRLGIRGEFSGSISLLSPHDPTYQGLLEQAKGRGQFGVYANPLVPYNVFQDAYFYGS
jgi:hypothetical protein